MNRRHFLTAMGGTTAAVASLSQASKVFAAEATIPFFVKGLVMISFEDSKVLRLGTAQSSGPQSNVGYGAPGRQPAVLELEGRLRS